MREDARGFYTGVALGVLWATALRALLSTLFYLSLATLRLNGSAALILALLAPALAPLLPRAARPVVALAGVSAALLPFARFTPAFVPLAALAAGAGGLAFAQASREMRVGVLLGIALNGALLLLDASHDPLMSPTGAAVMLALAAFAFLARRPVRPEARAEPHAARALAGLSWSALLALEVAYLASPYTLARLTNAAPWPVAAASVAGLAAGAMLSSRVRAWWVLSAAGAALALLAFVDGPLAPLGVLALQAAVGAAAVRLAAPAGYVMGPALAGLLFVLLFFREALPHWTLVVPLLAALALVPPLLRGRTNAPRLRGAWTVALVAALAPLAAPSALAPPAPEPHEGDELRVVSWNVHQGFGNRGALDPALYADVLRTLRPDVLVLQESDTAHLSSGGLDVVAYVARETGLRSVARGPGVAILARFPLAEGVDAAEPKAWSTTAALDVRGVTLHVHGVHLARNTQERHAQADRILALANATEGPRVLAGDINSCAAATCFGGRPSDRIHDKLALAYEDAWLAAHGEEKPEGHTHPAWNPARRIDVILVRDLAVLDAGPLRDARTALGSDHLPMTARLRIAT